MLLYEYIGIISTYFLFVMLISIPVVSIANLNDNSIFQCQYILDLFVEQGDGNCPPYDCWNSQLLDLSRDSLIKIFNDYKASIAQRKCEKCAYPGTEDFGPVFQMYYYWGLELLALHYQRVRQRDCEFQHRASISTDDFPDSVQELFHSRGNFRDLQTGKMEYALTSFKLREKDDQTVAIERFKLLMYRDRKHNLFEAWNGTIYRYTRVTAFGCILTIRNNVTGITAMNEIAFMNRVAYLACVFAFQRIANDLNYSTDRAQYQAVVDPRTKLYYYPNFEENIAGNIPCQFFYNFSNGALKPRCNHQIPRVWLKNETPDPRHRKIRIRWSNKAIIDLEVATGLVSVQSVQQEGGENDLELMTVAYNDGNSELKSDSTSVKYVEGSGAKLVTEEADEKPDIDESENLIEYDELVNVPVDKMAHILQHAMTRERNEFETKSKSVTSYEGDNYNLQMSSTPQLVPILINGDRIAAKQRFLTSANSTTVTQITATRPQVHDRFKYNHLDNLWEKDSIEEDYFQENNVFIKIPTRKNDASPIKLSGMNCLCVGVVSVFHSMQNFLAY